MKSPLTCLHAVQARYRQRTMQTDLGKGEYTVGAMSFWHWIVVLLIVAMVFGTGKLKNIGKDLGSAVKGFKEGLHEGEENTPNPNQQRVTHQQSPAKPEDANTIDVESKSQS